MYMLYQRSFPTPLFDSGSEKKKLLAIIKFVEKVQIKKINS